MSDFDFWSAAVGASLGLFTGLSLEWWKSSREDLKDLRATFSDIVTDASNVGAEFWLKPGDDPSAKLLLARLRGCQARVAGYNTLLVGRLDPECLASVDKTLAEFFKALTGGDPQDLGRAPSFERACDVYETASAAVIEIRLAFFTKMSFWQRVVRWSSRSRFNKTYSMRAPEHPFQS